jgi:heptosyltransferase-2
MRDYPPGTSTAQRRILVRGVNWLGDAVMSTPALQRLRERYPEAHLAVLSPEKLAEVWLHFRAIDRVITLDSRETPWSVGRRLRPAAFDTALVFPNSPRSALEAWFAGIPQRIGYARTWRNGFLTRPVVPRSGAKSMRKKSLREIHDLVRKSHSLPEEGAQRYQPRDHTASHQVNEYLHLVAQLGADPAPLRPSLAVPVEEIQATMSKFCLNDPAFAGKSFLALNPGAEYGPAKRWPVNNFIAAALEIQKRTNCALLLLGASPDLPLTNEIHSALRTPHSVLKNLAGQTSLRELMSLLKISQVLLTNDTGPMHIAAALGTPVVVPFGSTSPALTAPGLPGDDRHYLLTSDVPCAPCFRRTCPIDFRCMKAIAIERVAAAVLEVLAAAPEAVQRQK